MKIYELSLTLSKGRSFAVKDLRCTYRISHHALADAEIDRGSRGFI